MSALRLNARACACTALVVLVLIVAGCGSGGGGPVHVTGDSSKPVSLPGKSPNRTQTAQQVTFYDDGSTPAGSIVKWEWNFDAEHEGKGGWHDFTATQGLAEHAYPVAGSYEAHLRVTDDKGNKDTAKLRMVVTDEAPVAIVNIGTETDVITEPISESGGTITGPTGTPVEGITVLIPTGALDNPAQITLGYTDGSIEPVLGEFGGVMLTLDTDDNEQFYEPVTITVPFTPGDLPIPYYLDDQQRPQAMDIVHVDQSAGRFSFNTFHCSAFFWLTQNPVGGGSYASRFVPDSNGFQIRNRGTNYNLRGECMGFCAFAQWYLLNHPDEEPLFQRFVDLIGEKQIEGQRIITTRAFISTNHMWSSDYWPEILEQNALTELDIFRVVRNAIANTGQPQILFLNPRQGTRADNHLVLAYAVSEGNDPGIYIYDPNNPGDNSRAIAFDPSAPPENALRDYGVFELYSFVGSGTMYVNEPYSRIYEDAVADFNGSDDAQIVVTSHQAGESVDIEHVTLAGSVYSGSVLIEKMDIIVSQDGVDKPAVRVAVATDRTWQAQIELFEGTNQLFFVTYGELLDSGLVSIPNTQLSGFELTYEELSFFEDFEDLSRWTQKTPMGTNGGGNNWAVLSSTKLSSGENLLGQGGIGKYACPTPTSGVNYPNFQNRAIELTSSIEIPAGTAFEVSFYTAGYSELHWDGTLCQVSLDGGSTWEGHGSSDYWNDMFNIGSLIAFTGNHNGFTLNPAFGFAGTNPLWGGGPNWILHSHNYSATEFVRDLKLRFWFASDFAFTYRPGICVDSVMVK